MDKQQKIILLILGALLAVVLVAVIAVATQENEPIIGEFVPPPFENNAEKGIPEDLPHGFGTMTVRPDYVIGMCAAPSLDGPSLGLYFTSPETNAVWMKVRVYNEAGTLLGESGLLKPGEHLKTLVLDVVPPTADSLYATVLAYEPDTYYSEGSVNVELKIDVEK